MRRLVCAVGLLAVLVALAGCTSVFGPGQPGDSQLNENATYDWETNATTTYDVSKTELAGVVTVENRSWIKLYQTDELGNEEPLSVAALRFRYPNGTVVSPANSSLAVDNGRSRANVTLPQAGGQMAFTAERPKSKRFATPLFANGPHDVEVTLPPGARVGIPLLSQVSPPAENRWVGDDRMTVRWDGVSNGPLVLRYYLARDILIFGGLAGILTLAGLGGAVYYLREIRVLERKREEIGLDVEMEDDDFNDDGPPPGMR